MDSMATLGSQSHRPVCFHSLCPGSIDLKTSAISIPTKKRASTHVRRKIGLKKDPSGWGTSGSQGVGGMHLEDPSATCQKESGSQACRKLTVLAVRRKDIRPAVRGLAAQDLLRAARQGTRGPRGHWAARAEEVWCHCRRFEVMLQTSDI